jgi:hypothetical protein
VLTHNESACVTDLFWIFVLAPGSGKGMSGGNPECHEQFILFKICATLFLHSWRAKENGRLFAPNKKTLRNLNLAPKESLPPDNLNVQESKINLEDRRGLLRRRL